MTTATLSGTTLQRLRIAGTVLHAFALVATGFRAGHQWRRAKFFWDDLCAVMAATLDSILLATIWIRARVTDQQKVGRYITTQQARALHFVMSLTFLCTVWAARTSIACTIIRLLPSGRTKKFAIGMTGLFVTMWLVLFVQRCWVCGSDKTWVGDCPAGSAFTIEKLCSDIIADILLVAVPLYMLWRSAVPKGPRFMMCVVFTASLTTASLSALVCVYIMGPNRMLEGFAAHFEAAVTVMVCNLLIIVMCCYRVLRNSLNLDDELSGSLTSDGSQTRPPVTVLTFTRISTANCGNGTSIFHSQYSENGSTNESGPPCRFKPMGEREDVVVSKV